MDVTILGPNGLPLLCETCGNKATSTWSTTMAGGASGAQHYACDDHNPLRWTMAAPASYEYRVLRIPRGIHIDGAVAELHLGADGMVTMDIRIPVWPPAVGYDEPVLRDLPLV